MMFSTDKCSSSGMATTEECELFAGGGGAHGKEGVALDEVASAVTAVSVEIGDILKDEFVDGERADRIDAELADLSAELGLLAGLADGDPQPDFPSLFDLTMGNCGSGSGSSTSSSWSCGRNGRPTRPIRPQRPTRRRPIAKGKEISRRGGRRAAPLRVRRAGSDASDVGADSDSDDQWTELDDTCSSDCSAAPTPAVGDLDCTPFQHKSFSAEPPTMGQFLLPLLGTEESEQFFIRHEDILQLLASADESVRDDLPLDYDAPIETQPDVLPSNDVFVSEEPIVTPEEEAALLHYVCETERRTCESGTAQLVPVEEWLMGVYHTWCEISALMYTLIGTDMSVVELLGGWVWSGRFGCHCRLCLCLARGAPALAAFLRDLVWTLAHAGGSIVPAAAGVMRALGLRAGADNTRPDSWDLPRLRRINYTDVGEEIIHEQLRRLSEQSEIANEIVNKTCLCREYDKPFEKQYAVERFCKILETFKAASTTNFQVELLPTGRDNPPWMDVARRRLARYLAPHRRGNTGDRLREMAARTQPVDLNAWIGYKHRCDCRTPRTLCAEQRKQLLSVCSRISFFGMMQGTTNGNYNSSVAEGKASSETQPETSEELQQGDGTGAKPPDSLEGQPTKEEKADPECEGRELSDDHQSGDLDDITDSDVNSGTASLGLSTSSSLDSASELLLAAAAAVDSGGSEAEATPGELCRTVRHLMRSIASIERLMDRVLKHCDEWPAPPSHLGQEDRKCVDMGLSEVDRKLMAMYRRMPEVHRRQLQVYRKQKKLSTVCMQLVGGKAPAPPPPGSPPPTDPAPPAPAARTLCPEYHLQRFKEVRRKVMHMRDQQLYYHRLRRWLEDQLRHERESLRESNVTLVEDLPRRKRRALSPKLPRLSTAPKRKLKTISQSISKPHKILQMLKHKAPAQTAELLTKVVRTDDLKDDEPVKSEAEPPEAFPLEREDNISDAETIVGEKESVNLCKEMNECLAKFANIALNSSDNNLHEEYDIQTEPEVKYPETVSPPLQEMSPTTSEPVPVYTPKPSQRLLAVNKFLNRNQVEFNDKVIDFQTQVSPEIINVPLNARRMPLLVKDETEKDLKITDEPLALESVKDPNMYKYVTFGLEIKKVMEERNNIMNTSYSSIKDVKENDIGDDDSSLSLEQKWEVLTNLYKNPTEYLYKVNGDDLLDLNTANTNLSELVENMPQILANMPEIASKLSEFANASFELPEFVSIMSSLPDVNNEAQLTPETLKQIRELKLNKNRDSVKVTKNTAKRKMNRKIKNTIENNELVSTMTFELDSKDISELLKDDKELNAFLNNKTTGKEDFKDLLSSISAQVVINKVFEYLKNNKSTELAKCIEQEKDLFAFHKSSINWEMCSKASTLFDNSVKDVLSMDELRSLVKSRFNSWKHYVATKFKSISLELLDTEIEAMIDKFYSYIQDLAGKLCVNDSDKIVEKLYEIKNSKEIKDSDSDSCVASKESLKHMTKLLSTSACNTFDLLIMKLSKMSQDKKLSVKSLKFKYVDVIRRCAESQQLVGWILLDPEIASNVIQELTGLPIKKAEVVPDFGSMPNDKKTEYFLERLREMNKEYMLTLPKDVLTGDEWLVMLYRLEQLEAKLKDAFSKVNPPKQSTQSASEAEILVAKGLSKIIGKATVRIVKKTPEKKKEEKATETEKAETTPVKDEKETCDKKSKNEVLLAKCEAILTARGDTHLLDSFYAIKHYITQGKPVPEMYKNHVISICSSIDAKLLHEDANIEETLKVEFPELANKDLSTIAQSPELLAKYSAQALRNAKQTLNAVAFRNMMRNGQTKSESDACDTPKTECKWTNDCICNNCKNIEPGSVCLGDIVTKCYDSEGKKDKNGLEEKKKEVKPTTTNKPTMRHMKKMSDNLMQQQHICRVGHGGNNSYDARDPSCSCCYCTVFGHAPPLTAPVPRHYHQARDRLRTILDKKKQDWPVNAQEKEEILEKKPIPVPQAKPVQKQQQTQQQQQQVQQQQQPVVEQQQPAAVKPQKQPAVKQQPPQQSVAKQQQQPQQQTATKQPPTQQQPPAKQQPQQQTQQNVPPPKQKPPPQPTSKPPALPKTQPPNLTVSQLQQKQNAAMAQRRLTYKMAQMALSERPEQDRPTPTIYPQQKAQLPQPLAQQQQQQQQQKKPEPIYDLPIHNKPVLTPQQQAQIRQQQLQVLQQKQMQQQQQQEQNPQQQQRQARSGPSIMSVSTSRESSVFSTSSGCSGGSCWNGSRAEDHRDLDALLQYIEGPSRHTDRGKKRAKKQRQKLKKLESKLVEEHQLLTAELNQLRNNAHALQTAHAAARRRVDEARMTLAHHHQGKRKGKKNKLSPAQQAKVQLVAEQLGELTTLMNTTAKEVQAAERQVLECSRQLQQNVRHLGEARALQDMPDEYHLAFLQKQQQRFTQKQPDKRDDKQTIKLKKDKQTTQTQDTTSAPAPANAIPIRPVTSNASGPLKQLLQNNKHLVTHNVKDETPAPSATKQQQERKQTWEQALAHMNQLAKGANKTKSKEAPTPKSESKTKEPQRSQSLTDAKTLNKKQRKLLAKQQAEEEEKKRQQKIQQEAKNKKAEAKKAEQIKAETSSKKVDKKAEVKTVELSKSKKEKKVEKKGKENKPEKSAPAPLAATKQTKQTQSQQQSGKKKNKEKQTINITPDTTIEVLSNKQSSCQNMSEPEQQVTCSIMEQLSCGVQVADLKLPPGITLTKVQPTEKKDNVSIKSVPLWKYNELSVTPTPVAMPPPVINADPSRMMFSTHQPMIVAEPPKRNTNPEPAPGTGKSKKAKKRAKKAAAEENEGSKMVTLRNPMFHPNLPPVQITTTPPQKKPEIRIPDPVQEPSIPCQATITPTSNGMYTIRNPLVSMMHQQGLVGLRTPNQPVGNMYGQPQYTYTNPNVYNPVPPSQPTPTYLDPKTQKNLDTDYQNRFMNLASFTQKNDEGYSLFKPPEENQQRNFLTSEYYMEDPSPKPVVSPNPIGTRPTENRFESNESLFANPVQAPEPIGTPLKREESDFSGSFYTPFGHEDKNVFRNALFSDKTDVGNVGRLDDIGSNYVNGDPLPYFQRLRVGSKLNNEVSIHHVTESKFYKGQDPMTTNTMSGQYESMYRGAWPEAYTHGNGNSGCVTGEGSVIPDGSPASAGESAHEEESGFGAVGTRAHPQTQRPPGENPACFYQTRALQTYPR